MREDARPVVSMRKVSKSFGPVKALVDADLEIRAGSILGLVGQNGAGKSTIIKVLAGILKPDAGTVEIDGVAQPHLTPASVEKLGIHFIHQDRLLVPTATVGEAIFLRHEQGFGPFISRRAMARRANELLKRHFGFELPAGTLIQDLSTAQQKIVQITRALASQAKVLVLDEPTAALVKSEVDSLFQVLRRLRDDGIAIVFISHYMQEIQDLCDRVVVMRNGTDVGAVDPRDISDMFPKRSHAAGEPLLAVEGLSLKGSFRDVSFAVGRGEVVGITGLLGSGAKEIVECLFGLSVADGGSIRIDGKERRIGSSVKAVGEGIAMLPEDRRAHGVALGLSVRENTTLASLSRYSRFGFVDRGRERAAVDGLIKELAIKTPHGEALVRQLSGGNQQKVALAKWLSCQSRVYVLDEPTVAVDVGSKVEIYNLLNRLSAEGAAILMLSSDLLELVGFCDRILVVYRGELTGDFKASETDGDRLLAAASGARSQPKEIAA